MTALLLAEPEPSVRGFLERQLSSDGFDVLAFGDPGDLPRAAEPDVLVRGRDVTLAVKEYTLLLRMAQDPDRVLTREQLLRDVWGYRTFVPTRTVESHASRVRCKLAAAGLPGWVVNVWGVGYKLRP